MCFHHRVFCLLKVSGKFPVPCSFFIIKLFHQNFEPSCERARARAHTPIRPGSAGCACALRSTCRTTQSLERRRVSAATATGKEGNFLMLVGWLYRQHTSAPKNYAGYMIMTTQMARGGVVIPPNLSGGIGLEDPRISSATATSLTEAARSFRRPVRRVQARSPALESSRLFKTSTSWEGNLLSFNLNT